MPKMCQSTLRVTRKNTICDYISHTHNITITQFRVRQKRKIKTKVCAWSHISSKPITQNAWFDKYI